MSEWLARLSTRGLFAYFSIAFAVLLGLFGLLEGYRWSIVTAVLGGLAFGALMTYTTVQRRRRLGPTWTAINPQVLTALRTGALPGLVDAGAWLAVLAVKRANVARGQWPVITLIAALVLVQLVLALGNPHWPVNVGFATLLTGVTVWRLVAMARQIPKVDALDKLIRDTYSIPKTPRP